MADILCLATINAVVFFAGYYLGRARGERIGRLNGQEPPGIRDAGWPDE